MAKKKKEKIIYYDDNSTLHDMSNVNRKGQKEAPRPPRKQSTFGEKMKTYWNSVKMMLFPMCVVLLILVVLYVFAMLISGNIG